MLWLIALIIGLVNAVVLYFFEIVGIDGTVWLWNDVLQTDTYRWLVIPVGLALGLVLTATFKLVKMQRIQKESSGELLDEIDESPSTLKSIGAVLLVGAVSLLAGASLGPEASLIAFSLGIAVYVSSALKQGSAKHLIVLASVGALLVAFCHSIVMVLVPLLLLFQQSKKNAKRPGFKPVLLILLAGVVSWGVILYLHHVLDTEVIEVIPALPPSHYDGYLLAAALGFITALFAGALHYSVKFVSYAANHYNALTFKGKNWLLGAGAGLLLGALYFIGGQDTQFSGKVGTEALAEHGVTFGFTALIIMLVVKIATTALSSGTGYRGGLVFPSVFIGFTIGLIAYKLFPDISYTAAIIGSISGIMTAAVGSALVASIFLIAALPVEHWPLAACAVVGTMCFMAIRKLIDKKTRLV